MHSLKPERRVPLSGPVGALLLCLVAVALHLLPTPVFAQDDGVLGECMALSPVEDDIHACLDNYLDVMDDNLRDITSFIRREFDGESLEAFNRSQASFEIFRRENCLWYLAISSPRSAAEQIAKNCLAQSSIDRLAELQGLLSQDDASTQVVDGFYVYGANRNSFRPCGTDGRFLVEGDASAVGDLQQRYTSLASVDLQILFASVTGQIDNTADGGQEHDGVINISSVRDLRFPSDSDCSLRTGSPQVTAAQAGSPRSVEERVADVEPFQADTAQDLATTEAAESPAPVSTVNPVGDPGPVVLPDTGPAEQQATTPASPPSTPSAGGGATAGNNERLTAYFGAWLADCLAVAGDRRCRLVVDLEGGEVTPTLTLDRFANGRTNLELDLPGRELESVDQILWGIDTFLFGKVPGSELTVAEQSSVQRVLERHFVDNEVMPLMKRGSELRIEIGSAANGGAARYRATLVGLSRALDFADDFLGL